MERYVPRILLLAICLGLARKAQPNEAAPPAPDDKTTLTLLAKQIYQQALRIQDVWFQPGDSVIHLQRGVLIQNDSPGCGRRDNDAGVFEEVSGSVVLRKELETSGPIPEHAEIVFIAKERLTNDAELEFVVNGNTIVRRSPRFWAPDAMQYQVPEGGKDDPWAWSRWQYQQIPSADLHSGKNTILIRSKDGKPGWALMVADYADFHKGCSQPMPFPHASAKSDDDGRTWRQNDLGSEGKISGEYVVRLWLDSYRPTGVISSDIVDLGGEAATFKTLCDVQGARFHLEGKTAQATALSAEVRSGSSPVYDPQHWSTWLQPAADGSVPAIRGRYFQWRIKFTSSDPEASPELTGIRLEAEVHHHGSAKIRVVREDNFNFHPAPEGYRYEDYESDYLQKFRRQFQLDQVVAGAQTDWERQLRLMRWAYLVPLKAQTPIFPWDPMAWIDQQRLSEALKANTYPERRRDAMCLFSNVPLMAALQSMGYPARHINLATEGVSGHEIAEVWSNLFGKWIHLDATIDAFWYNKGTGTPVNTLEMHQALIDRLQHPETWEHPFYYTQPADTYLLDFPIVPAGGFERKPIPQETIDWTLSATSQLRMVPRSDVFSHPSPIPISQGDEIWCWSGYLNWADAKVPPVHQFSRFTNRPEDFNWPLNQVRYVAEETATPGVVNITLDDNMPYLATLLVRVDRGEWKEVRRHFPWTLHAGINTVEFRGRNDAGVEGMTSGLILECIGCNAR